jgi:L-ascorbate metabolism protein UlaG (beta-lactamase superfamily)
MRISLLPLLLGLLPGILPAQNVKITPVGARTGEFCSPDRALILEDPTGLRILFDPATTVAGGADTRLGAIHALLVSHAHGDHLGSAKLTQNPDDANAACASGVLTVGTANSNAVEIAAAKSSAVVVASDLATFLGRKLQTFQNGTGGNCPAAGDNNEMTVPRPASCVAGTGYGAKRTLRMASAQAGVQIALVPAAHGNGVPTDELADPLRSEMTANGLSFAPGQASSYVVRFTNGLTVFLSGDTGLTSEMQKIVRGYYGADLAVFNIGDIFTTGPEVAAFAINTLIKPAAVIPSHANEQATANGSLIAGTKTARFADLVKDAAVIPPLSGVTMEFDSHGNCVAGCQGKPGRGHR